MHDEQKPQIVTRGFKMLAAVGLGFINYLMTVVMSGGGDSGLGGGHDGQSA